MEKNYNTDNFEQLLKETTDNFRMYPSKRVWHSLYNDLHPGRKWPSIAVLLLLITSITYLGLINANETDVAKNTVVALAEPIMGEESAVSVPATHQVPVIDMKGNPLNQKDLTVSSVSIPASPTTTYRTASSENLKLSAENNFTTSLLTNNLPADNHYTNSVGTNTLPANTTIIADNNKTILIPTNVSTYPTPLAKEKIDYTNNQEITLTNTAAPMVVIASATQAEAAKKTAGTSQEKIYTADNSWMDHDVFYNKKTSRKWKEKISYQVYVTPSLGYRKLIKNTDYTPQPANSLISNPAQANTAEYTMDHASAVNLEAGTNAIFRVSKNLRLKAGVQLNYTNYSIRAYELNHPTFTTLLLNDVANGYPYLASRTTVIANSAGLASDYLNNNTYQVSIPIGADFRIAGKKNFKWYAGATVQPTYVTGGHSYLISSDLKNYVSGESLMRKFNLNGGVETFVSYKTKNGIIISAGPQLRYQFLSTYSKEYTYDEKLYNMGIKLGMTTNF